VPTVENLSILSVSGISPGHPIDWEELTAKLDRDKIPAAPGLVEYGKFRAGIGRIFNSGAGNRTGNSLAMKSP
jgi:hypothetical protein